MDNNQMVGTGSHDGNHITRVYVLPEFQGKGYGSFIMQCLEDEIAMEYHTVENGELDFYYQHINSRNQIRAGKCHSTPRILGNGKIELNEEWQWLNGDSSRGSLIVTEI